MAGNYFIAASVDTNGGIGQRKTIGVQWLPEGNGDNNWRAACSLDLMAVDFLAG